MQKKLPVLLFISLVFYLFPARGFCFDAGKVVIITSEKVSSLQVQYARTPEEWQQGIKGKKALNENEGMFFIFPRETVITFTTEGVLFPIDIILINKEGRVVKIHDNASGDRYHASPVPIIAALEVRGGFSRDNGIKTGSMIRPVDVDIAPSAPARSKSKENEKAEVKLKENIKKYPDDFSLREELAGFYLRSGQGEKSADVFQKLLKTEVTAQRLCGLGIALTSMGKFEEAQTHFKAAIEKDPLFFESYNYLTRIFLKGKSGSADELEFLLKAVLEKKPDFLDARLCLGKIYLAEGDIDAAETLFEDILNQPGKTHEVIRMAGDIYLRKGDNQKAADYYLEYLDRKPFTPDSADLRAFILVHKVKEAQERRK